MATAGAVDEGRRAAEGRGRPQGRGARLVVEGKRRAGGAGKGGPDDLHSFATFRLHAAEDAPSSPLGGRSPGGGRGSPGGAGGGGAPLFFPPSGGGRGPGSGARRGSAPRGTAT